MKYKYSDSPCDKNALRLTLEELLSKRLVVRKGNDWEWIISQASVLSGGGILDIGAVGHDIENASRPDWKFKQLSAFSDRVVGVDILEAECAELQKRGHSVFCVDATSDADLGQRFSLITIGDVIEHVNNPVAMLNFAKRHLEPNGRLLVATPNPHYFNTYARALRHGTAVDNLEHVSWISPFQALELGRRTGLELTRYASFINRSRIWRSWALRRPISDCYSSNFVFEFMPTAS